MDDIWVGGRRGSKMLWVYDPSMKHIDPDMVYLYSVNSKEMKEHPREFARGVLHKVVGEKSHPATLNYRNWYELNGAVFLERDRAQSIERKEARDKKYEELERRENQARKLQEEKERRTHEEYLEKHKRRRETAKKRHREHLQDSGIKDQGTTIAKRKHRTTHCYSCEQALDSNLFLECNACHWMICYCGACGCTYEYRTT